MKWDIRKCRETNLDSLVGSNKVGDLHWLMIEHLKTRERPIGVISKA
jgi:hypothetical protein